MMKMATSPSAMEGNKNANKRSHREALQLNEMTGWDIREIENRIRQSVPKGYW